MNDRMAGLATRLGSLPGLPGLTAGPAKLLAVAPAVNSKVVIILFLSIFIFLCLALLPNRGDR